MTRKKVHMYKITFLEFEKYMLRELNKKSDSCIEIWFDVDECIVYQGSWLGKMIDKNTKRDTYWFGLVPDGSQAYDYDSFEEFANAKVFYGNKSLKEIWTSISILSLDGGPADEMLQRFFKLQQ